MKKVKTVYGYELMQSQDTLELYVRIPKKENKILDISKKTTIHIDTFLKEGIISVVSNVLYLSQISAKIALMHERDIHISHYSKNFEHSIHFEAAIKLDKEIDNTNGIIPLILTCDKDGNFFSIASPAIITKSSTIYQSYDHHITSVFKHDEVNIINSFAPSLEDNFSDAAHLLTAIVIFSKRILSQN